MKNDKKREYYVAFRNFIFWYKMTEEEANRYGFKKGEINEGTEKLIKELNEKFYEGSN